MALKIVQWSRSQVPTLALRLYLAQNGLRSRKSLLSRCRLVGPKTRLLLRVVNTLLLVISPFLVQVSQLPLFLLSTFRGKKVILASPSILVEAIAT